MAKNIQTIGRPKSIEKKWIVPLGIALFLAELIYGINLAVVQDILPADSVSRVANAYYVLAVKPSRLSSIGLIWNPLPSLLELPLAALAPLWRPLVSKAVASCVVTALFASLSVIVLLKTFMEFRISRFYSIFITIFYAIHPYVFYYGANGMTESMLFFFLIYCTCKLTLWIRYGTADYIVKIAFGLTGGFLVRYEMIPFAVGIGLCVVLNILFNQREKPYWTVRGLKKERYFYIEGTLVMLYTPAIYAGIIWILVCWIITGNPLYFYNSNYSNLAQSAYAAKIASIPGLISYVSFRALPFLTVFFAVVLMRIVQKRLLRCDFICFFLLVMSLLTFHTLMYWRGTSFGWLRFFCYSLPICIAWLPYELSTYQSESGDSIAGYHFRNRGFAGISDAQRGALNFTKVLLPISLVISVLLLNNVTNGRAISDYDGSTHDQENQIAEYINVNLPDRTILTDVFTTYNVALNVDHFENLVVSSSPNFKKCVADPVGNGIEYILVPDPKETSFDEINFAYSDLYYHGTDWCKEEADFGHFKLFRVTG